MSKATIKIMGEVKASISGASDMLEHGRGRAAEVVLVHALAKLRLFNAKVGYEAYFSLGVVRDGLLSLYEDTTDKEAKKAIGDMLETIDDA